MSLYSGINIGPAEITQLRSRREIGDRSTCCLVNNAFHACLLIWNQWKFPKIQITIHLLCQMGGVGAGRVGGKGNGGHIQAYLRVCMHSIGGGRPTSGSCVRLGPRAPPPNNE